MMIGKKCNLDDLIGRTRQQIEARLGPPFTSDQPPKKQLWVYTYDGFELFFDADDIVFCYYELKN